MRPNADRRRFPNSQPATFGADSSSVSVQVMPPVGGAAIGWYFGGPVGGLVGALFGYLLTSSR